MARPPGGLDALRLALVDALGDRDRLRRMGDEGRAIVEREFSWEAATTRLLQVYDEILGARRGED